jgi:hypothetical protein
MTMKATVTTPPPSGYGRSSGSAYPRGIESFQLGSSGTFLPV